MVEFYPFMVIWCMQTHDPYPLNIHVRIPRLLPIPRLITMKFITKQILLKLNKKSYFLFYTIFIWNKTCSEWLHQLIVVYIRKMIKGYRNMF